MRLAAKRHEDYSATARYICRLMSGALVRALVAGSCRAMVLAILVLTIPCGHLPAQTKSEARDMKLVGFSDLQGRASYMPIIKKQGERWYAYVGAQDGKAAEMNPLTG